MCLTPRLQVGLIIRSVGKKRFKRGRSKNRANVCSVSLPHHSQDFCPGSITTIEQYGITSLSQMKFHSRDEENTKREMAEMKRVEIPHTG